MLERPLDGLDAVSLAEDAVTQLSLCAAHFHRVTERERLHFSDPVSRLANGLDDAATDAARALDTFAALQVRAAFADTDDPDPDEDPDLFESRRTVVDVPLPAVTG